jgi:hypothetical protein
MKKHLAAKSLKEKSNFIADENIVINNTEGYC